MSLIFGASDGTCPPAGGAVVGSDCHWQSFTPDPSSPVPLLNKNKRYPKGYLLSLVRVTGLARLRAVLWSALTATGSHSLPTLQVP